MKRYLVVFDNKDKSNRHAGVEVIDQDQYDKLMNKDNDDAEVHIWWDPAAGDTGYVNTLEDYRKYIKVNEITEDEYKLLKILEVHSVGNTMLDNVFGYLIYCDEDYKKRNGLD